MLYRTNKRREDLPVDIAMRDPEHVDRWDIEFDAHLADQSASETKATSSSQSAS